MKVYFCFLLFWAILPWQNVLAALSCWQGIEGEVKAEDWGALTNGVQMSISVENGKEISFEKPVKLSFSFKAVSTNELPRLSRQSDIESDDTYSFIIISPSGKDISPSTKPRFIPGSGGSCRTPFQRICLRKPVKCVVP